MDARVFHSFRLELDKLAKAGVVELLANKAMRKGLDPSKIPAINQVGNILSSGNRGRAAEVANNIRGFLGTPMPKAAEAKLAVSKDRLAVAQTRTGRRPMRVDTMLKKDRDGTLYKRKGDVPTIDGTGERPIAEQRQGITYANIATSQGERFNPAEGFQGY